jgi:hypothetical protein
MKNLQRSLAIVGLLALGAMNSSCGGGDGAPTTTTANGNNTSTTSGSGGTAPSAGTQGNTSGVGSTNNPPNNPPNSTPDTPVVPLVTAAPTCAPLVTGTYELLDPVGATLAQSVSRTVFNAAALTTTSPTGTVTQWSADTTACSFSTSNGQSLSVSQSGIGVMRAVNGTARALLMVPVQTFSFSELTGKFNFVSFDKVGGAPTYSTLSGFIEFSPAATVTNTEICQYSTHDVCNPTNGVATSLTVNSTGGFDWTDSAGSAFRAFGFKGADGTKLLLAVRLNAGGIMIATPPRALLTPVVNSITSDKAIRIDESGASGALLSRRYTTTAIGVTNFTRQRQSDSVFETLSVNLPAPGFLSIKPRGDASPGDFGLIGLSMPGLGLSASIDTISNALTFSIAQ